MSDDNGQTILSLGRKLSELQSHGADDPNELLKDRFLCREGTMGLYGPTGIGKSSFLMQCIILWGLGREAFEIEPKQALRVLLIQAENDDCDLAEMRDGVCEGLGLKAEEKALACDRITVIHEDSKVGSTFFKDVVEPALNLHKPDLLCIDCALSYLGGDILKQEVVSTFLRNDLKPLLTKYNCGCIMVHHTNKSGNSDSAYAGSGSAEWANMPRGVLVLLPAGKAFKLIGAKRGNRLGWTMPDGETPTLEKRIKHSSKRGRIFWEECNGEENKDNQEIDINKDQEEAIMQRVPEVGRIKQKDLLDKVNQETPLGQNKIKDLIKQLIAKNRLFTFKKARNNGPAEIHYCRTPEEAESKLDKAIKLIEQAEKRHL